MLNSSSVNQVTVFLPNSVFNNTVVNKSSYTVKSLPPGTKITLSVTAQANHSLEGDTVTVIGFTSN